MFEQVHEAGREAAFDFTDCGELGVTIGGVAFAHLLFQLVLSFSKWRFVCLAYAETFEAMLRGLQSGLWALGGVPRVWRSDNLSAATRQLVGGGRELTRRYQALLDHYGAQSTRIEPGESHQNGIAEKAHDVLKSAVRQALLLRGSCDFASVAAYLGFVDVIVGRLNGGTVSERLAEERSHLQPLPSSRIPEYTSFEATVRQWRTRPLRPAGVLGAPSRLIGHEVEVRQHADLVEVWYRGTLTETMPRLRGEQQARIDYRHVIWSLVRKPGAFARYRFREEMFPTLVFRRAYDALVQHRGERADVEYVRILHLAASTMQALVEDVLQQLLERGAPIRLRGSQGAVRPRQADHPCRRYPATGPLGLRPPARRRRCRMTSAAFIPDSSARLRELLTRFKLPTVANEVVSRFTAAGHELALPVLLEVLEAEDDERGRRRCERLLKASQLPPRQDL